MTGTRNQDGRTGKLEIEGLVALADVGAGRAAEAFAQLVGRTIHKQAPVVVESPPASHSEVRTRPAGSTEPAEAGSARGAWCTGVFFEFEGCLDAIVGILFPASSSEALVRRIVGIESGELAVPLIESALMEVGNILASHVASAIADASGERLLPSIPSLAMVNAEESLAVWIEERVGADAPRVEVGLSDEARELEGRLVLVPTRPV